MTLKMYYSETSTKCLFCKKGCVNSSLGKGKNTIAEYESVENSDTTCDNSGNENHGDRNVQNDNIVANELLDHQEATSTTDNRDSTNKQDQATKPSKSKEKNESCSCYTFPVPFLGSTQDKLENTDGFQENLRYAFLLRTLLDYPKRKVMKYLKQQCQRQVSSGSNTDGKKESESEGWFSVCETCTKLVEEGHQLYHEIEKLSAQLVDIKDSLKDLIVINPEEPNANDANNEIESQNNEDENLEENTIFSEIQKHFAPRKIVSSTDKTVVKMEIESSSEYSNDDRDGRFIDDIMNSQNFDDGSDWAPSETSSELDGDDDMDEQVDVKPDIDNIQLDAQQSTEIENTDTTALDQGTTPEAGVSKRVYEKPGPKSRKLIRATRFSRRMKNKILTDDTEDTNQEVEDEDIAIDAIIVQDKSLPKTDSSMNISKNVKSILSDSDSESLTESEQSDNSDDDDIEKKTFTCDICAATYHTKHRLREHKKLHSSEESFKCDLCSFVAASNRGLNMHLTKIHKKKRREELNRKEVKRNKVGPPGKMSSILAKKLKTYEPKPLKVGSHKCPFCPVTYQTAHRLKEHEEHHLNMTSSTIKCQHCNYVCLLERGLKIHITKYHSEANSAILSNKHKEKQSKKEFSDSQEEFSDEDEEPSADILYPCDICCAVYKTRGRLREHKKLHKRSDVTRCVECPYVCNTRKGLAMHMHEQHGMKQSGEKAAVRPRHRKKTKVYSNDPHKCELCPAKYYTDHRFKQHMQLHSSELNFPCEKCGWVFSSAEKRSYHLKLSHKQNDAPAKSEPKSYQCSHCDIPPFSLRYKFKEHLLLNHKDKVFQCSSCSHIYESKQLYELHIEKCYTNPEKNVDDEDDGDEGLEEKKFACVDCNARFSKQDMLNRHFALRHSTEQFPCSICTSVFPTESRLRYHMARQHNKIQNVCKICGYKAHGASHLRLHMQKHTKERLFACEICGKTFVSPTYLTAHRQKEHYNELGLEPLKCDQCDLLFPNNSILKYHKQKVHEKKFKFFCEVCGKGFLFASGLKNHSAIHSNERTEICQICGASYVHNRVLMEHIKHHHPEEYAAVKGIDPSAIKSLAGFNTQGPFICKFCNVEFPSRWGLHTHMKSHTEIYDKYKCAVCGKGYSSPAGVKRHEETAHVAATYSCQNCEKTFPCKDYLRYHIKNHCNKKSTVFAVKSEIEPGPSTSKRRKNPDQDIKIADPHIVKEAGQLHIVTPGTAASSHAVNQGHDQQTAFSQSHVQSGASSSAYGGVSSLAHQQNQPLNDETAVNTFYRSYFSQPHGFQNK